MKPATKLPSPPLPRAGQQRAYWRAPSSASALALGLGRLLMLRLIEWCRENAVTELWGDVMDDNTPMLELASHLGFHRTSTHGSPGLVRITLQLAPIRH